MFEQPGRAAELCPASLGKGAKRRTRRGSAVRLWPACRLVGRRSPKWTSCESNAPERPRRLKFGKRAGTASVSPQAEQSRTKQEWSARTGCAVAAESTSASANTRVFMDCPPLRGSLLASHAKSYRSPLIDPIAEVFRRFPELSSSFASSVEDVENVRLTRGR